MKTQVVSLFPHAHAAPHARALLAPAAFAALCGIGLLASPARSQTFSIDYRGPTIGVVSPVPITAGDILKPMPPAVGYAPPALPPPTITIAAGGFPVPALGIPTGPGCVGVAPGVPCPIEVDALSYGTDFVPPTAPASPLAGTWVFSVDEWAVGIAPSPLAPSVLTEAPCADTAPDVFEALNIPAGPVPPPIGPPVPGNSGLLDGNGFVSPCGGRYQGLGLIEPRPAFAGPGPRPGDNLDALDIDGGPTLFGGAVFFSLDAGFLDPCPVSPNLGSALANGFVPGAILISVPPGPPATYVPALALGLDLFGTATDDLDALVFTENGVPGYQAGVGGDIVRFSVRRGSAIIGTPDSNFGAPIEPGDILMPPPGPGIPPGIFIPAELLGLATARTGTGIFCGGMMRGDDLDALDTRMIPETGLGYCFGDGTGTPCPCANSGANGHGCANSIFPAGGLLTAAGSASVSADTVLLTASSMSGAISVYFQGTGQASMPFDDGLFCLSGAFLRVGTYGVVGSMSTNPPAAPSLSVKGGVPAVGGTRFYQVVYRNAAPAFCPPATLNRTNGTAIVWTP